MTRQLLLTAVPAVSLALSGLIGGLAYFAALRRAVELVAGGHGWLGSPAVLTAARVAGMALLLLPIARLGAAPLVEVFTGFLVARAIALHQARSTW